MFLNLFRLYLYSCIINWNISLASIYFLNFVFWFGYSRTTTFQTLSARTFCISPANCIKNAITVLSFLLFLSLHADSINYYYLPALVTGQQLTSCSLNWHYRHKYNCPKWQFLILRINNIWTFWLYFLVGLMIIVDLWWLVKAF